MNYILDHTLVALALIASASYALFALGPRPVKQAIVRGVAAALQRLEPWGLSPALAQRLSALQGDSGGCNGGCSDCGSAAPVGTAATSEIRVPLTQIGRRA